MPSTTSTDAAPRANYRIAGGNCPLCWCSAGSDPWVCSNGHAPLHLSWPWSTEEEYEAWYTDEQAYHVDEQAANGQRACDDEARYALAYQASRHRCRFYYAVTGKDYQERHRLLDVGAGNMAFVDLSRTNGYEARGIDPSPLREDCQRGTWRDVEGLWDLITLHDVFEHLTRPRECLRHLQSCLTPSGVLVIEMPEWDGPHQRKHGLNWRHIRPRQHICLYSRGAAEQMYAEEGCEVIAFHRPLRGSIGKMAHLLITNRDERGSDMRQDDVAG